MKTKRFSEEQIIVVLKEAEAGAKTKDLCRRHGISDATFYNWKAKYAGMTESEARRLNRKRVYRLYREAGLAVRRRKRKRIGVFERKPLPKPTAADVSWSMDFVADGLIGGQRLRCLAIVDDCTLAIEVDRSILGLRVQGVLERLADTRDLPRSITVDNGPDFDGRCSINGPTGPAFVARASVAMPGGWPAGCSCGFR